MGISPISAKVAYPLIILGNSMRLEKVVTAREAAKASDRSFRV